MVILCFEGLRDVSVPLLSISHPYLPSAAAVPSTGPIDCLSREFARSANTTKLFIHENPINFFEKPMKRNVSWGATHEM